MTIKKLLSILCLFFVASYYCQAANSDKGTFYSSSLSLPCDYDKLAMLLAMDIDKLIIDEDFTIDVFKGKLTTNIPNIVGQNVTFDIKTDITTVLNGKIIPEVLIDLKAPIEYLGGISFNFNGNACRSAVFVNNTSIDTKIENLSITDIDVRGLSLEQQTYIIGLYVKLSNNSNVIVRNISANNLYSTANKIIGDSCGNISAIYITGKAGVQANLEVCECQFNNIHNYDSDRQMILEDTNGIYVSLGSPVQHETKIHIHDIVGVDYGKRLIKTDCSNLLVENIKASSKYDDTLSAISLNNGDGKEYYNAVIDNIHFIGTTQYVVGSSVPHTRISNVYSEITMAPNTYSAAILPSESCYAENLFLKGAQLISCVTNTNRKVVIKNVDYDDTMYCHGLYGSALFLTKEANLDLSNINIKSDKMTYLFFDNYYNQTSYDTNIVANIDNLSLNLYKPSNNWILVMNGQNHIWDISIKNSKFVLNAPVRGLIGITPANSTSKKMSLSMKNVEVIYNDLDPNSTIPFGMISFAMDTKLSLRNVKVYNNSDKSFSSSLYSFYIKNLTEENTYNNLYISDCNIDQCKSGKLGIFVTGKNVVWSGSDIITHSNPSSISLLDRNHKKFTYKDYSGRKYRWTGYKWKKD